MYSSWVDKINISITEEDFLKYKRKVGGKKWLSVIMALIFGKMA